LADYSPRWYTRSKTVTNPSCNRARRALTSFMPNAANHYATTQTDVAWSLSTWWIGWSKSKLLISSEYVNKTEKIGGM